MAAGYDAGPAPAAAETDQQCVLQKSATVHSLTSHSGKDLNGKTCRVDAYDPALRRFVCRFDVEDEQGDAKDKDESKAKDEENEKEKETKAKFRAKLAEKKAEQKAQEEEKKAAQKVQDGADAGCEGEEKASPDTGEEKTSPDTQADAGTKQKIVKLKAEHLQFDNGSAGESINAMCEIVPIVGAGLGVIAKKAITLFTRVIVDDPVLTFNDPMGTGFIHGTMVEELKEKLKELTEEQKRGICAMANKNVNTEFDHSLENLEHQIVGILQTNSQSSVCSRTTSQSAGGVLNLKIARVNHSCVPNCEYRWNEGKDELPCIYAIRDIEPGEQITIAYVHVFDAKQQRQMQLRMRYKFVCKCPACLSKIDTDQIRMEIEQSFMDCMEADIQKNMKGFEGLQKLKFSLPIYECMLYRSLCKGYQVKGDKEKAIEAGKKSMTILIQLFPMNDKKIQMTMGMLKELNVGQGK